MLEEEFLEAVAKGDTQRVVRLLGQTSAATASSSSDTTSNCRLPTKNGQNALHIAAQVGNADVVSVLLLSGIYDCKTADSSGYSALQIAAAEGHLEVIKLLIKANADVNSADKVHGNTALHEASWKGYSQTICLLAKGKADLNIKNWGGFTALHLCCQKGHNQSCRELLIAGCDPDIQNNYGDTALHTSARYGHAGVMRILISAKCHISDQNKNGDTALHIAAAMSHRKLTRILLEAGCNKSILNKQHETAEDIAIRKSLVEIVDILRSTTIFSASSKKTKSAAKPNEKTTNAPIKIEKTSKSKHAKKENVKDKSIKKTNVPWSPYGCHYYPDASDFPEPKLNTLPNEPLKKGEQYYLDLAGNIRKGPIGVGYTCYCAPFFKQLESHLEKKTKQLKKRLNDAEENINQRLKTVEQNLNIRRSSQHQLDNRRSFHAITNSKRTPVDFSCLPKDAESMPVLRTRSLEYIFEHSDNRDVSAAEHHSSKPHLNIINGDSLKENVIVYRNVNCALTDKRDSKQRQHTNGKYEKYLPSDVAGVADMTITDVVNNDSDNFRSSHHQYCRDLNSSKCESLYSLYTNSIDTRAYSKAISNRVRRFSAKDANNNNNSASSCSRSVDVWAKSTKDSCESSNGEIDDDDDGIEVEPNVDDIQCNDSGYGTKMCSNSQGPSPSLSGRLESDGLLSGTPSQDGKHCSDMNVYSNPYQSMSIGAASIV